MAIPTNTVLPTLTGEGVEGSTLTGTYGEWTDTPTSHTVLWRRSDIPETIAGATGLTYTLTAADVGHNISFRVAATNADGTSDFAVAENVLFHVTGNPDPEPEPEVTLSEEERAALYRQQCAKRAAWRARTAAALAGDPAAAAAVRTAFAPLLAGPADAWDCPDVPEPARPAWAGRVPGDIELPEYLKRGG